MRKFYRKDLIAWILQMEKYFDQHNVQKTQKVCITILYLELNEFVWYRWICSLLKLVTLSVFMEEMIVHFEDTKRNTFFS